MLKKITNWLSSNILFLVTVFLLVFIPLYPKLPLVNVRNTWVYVRWDDILVLLSYLLFAALFFKKKIGLKTPLTFPIIIFWIVGAVAVLHGILIIFPNTANVFPNVALLSYLRHIEYLGIFFVSYAGFKDKKLMRYFLTALVGTYLGVVLYGLGQRYLSFPAYLTMNEQFAKGTAIYLSPLSRISSTFAGHYDLAAYLVLVTPILVSLILGVKNFIYKIFLGILVALGFVVMFMTVSRISFFALLAALFVILLFQKKKFIMLSVPVIAVAVIAVGILGLKSTLLQRFGNTVKGVDVMVNGKTGAAIGNVEYVPVEYLYNKNVKLQRVENSDQLGNAIGGNLTEQNGSTNSALLPYMFMAKGTIIPLVKASNLSTGENLPQGTGYTNLALSPVKKRVGDFYYELSPNVVTSASAQIIDFNGDFIIKRATAYDLSFTTRFQGEWPRTLLAFERNIFIGSGYGSVSLAVDNNFLRMLGETGLLGLAAFLGIFLVIGIYIKKTYSEIDSKLVKSFIVGYVAGVIGLFINATLIDVFEASKDAYVLWILSGVAIALTQLYSEKRIDIVPEIKKAAASVYAVIFYILIFCVSLFSRGLSSLFVGSDYTWIRIGSTATPRDILKFFTDFSNPVYDPLTKLYFYIMYNTVWLNQDIYHLVSLFLFFIVAVLFFIISLKIFKEKLPAVAAVLLFVVLSGYSEVVFWISPTGFLFSVLCSLLSLILFTYGYEKNKKIYYALSVLLIIAGVLFNAIAVISPLLIIFYRLAIHRVKLSKVVRGFPEIAVFIPVILYITARYKIIFSFISSQSVFPMLSTGINNIVSYLALGLLGGYSSIVTKILRSHSFYGIIILLALVISGVFVYKKLSKPLDRQEKGVVYFAVSLFVAGIIPFIFSPLSPSLSLIPSLGILLIIVLILKKLYGFLLPQGKPIAAGIIVVAFLVFSLIHIIQEQQVVGDWQTAGDITQNFFISVDDLYNNGWEQGNLQLSFVNVPVKNGGAWVFPSGLQDALWFAFQNKDLKVNYFDTVGDAVKNGNISPQNRLFEFQNDGTLQEIHVVKKGT